MTKSWLIALLIAAILALLKKDVQGQQHPDTINVNPGETVRLNCSTSSHSSADWHYRKTDQAGKLSIYIGNSNGGGKISNSYKSRTRYSVYVDIANGRYDLVIENVTKSDEGTYICSDTSDPDISTSTHLIILEEKLEECPYDEAAITGEFLQLSFHTTQSDSIHVEHRSTDRSYPLHVFREGKIVNDYYVLSGRFGFNRSSDTWNLLVKNVQLSDAGTYICSEDNGLGRQYTKELVVIDKTVKCEIGEETCMHNEVHETNVTCAANFSGQYPPRLQLRRAADGHEEKTKVLNDSVAVTSPTNVQLRTVVSGDDLAFQLHLLFTVSTPNSYIVLASVTTAYHSEVCKKDDNSRTLILVVILACLLLLSGVVMIYLFFFKYKKYKSRMTSSRERATDQNLLPNSEEMKAQPVTRQIEVT